MSLVTVTKKTNVKDVTEDGDIFLYDEGAIGYLRKTHASVVTVHDENGQPQLGFLARVEVFWENQRSPSPALEDPNELVWLDLGAEDAEDEEEQEDFDTEDEKPESQTEYF